VARIDRRVSPHQLSLWTVAELIEPWRKAVRGEPGRAVHERRVTAARAQLGRLARHATKVVRGVWHRWSHHVNALLSTQAGEQFG
jgi:hypothetical protein